MALLYSPIVSHFPFKRIAPSWFRSNIILPFNNSFIKLYNLIRLFGNLFIKLGNSFTELGNLFTELGNLFTELGNSFTELGNSFTELGNSFTELGNSIPLNDNQERLRHICCIINKLT